MANNSLSNLKNTTPNSMRRVRFALPSRRSGGSGSGDDGNQPNQYVIEDTWSKVHGTTYVNGTLNSPTSDYKSTLSSDPVTKIATPKPKLKLIARNQLTNDGSAAIQLKKLSTDQQYWNNAVNRRGILLPVRADSAKQSEKNVKSLRSGKLRNYTAILREPSNCLKRTRISLLGRPKSKHIKTPNTLALPVIEKKKHQPTSNETDIFEKFSYKLADAPQQSKSKKHTLRLCFDFEGDDDDYLYELSERASSIIRTVDADIAALAGDEQQKLEQHCSSENLSEILQVAHRWQSSTNSTATSNKLMPHMHDALVEFCTLKKSEVKLSKSSSFSAGDRRNLICMAPSKLTKMSTDQLPLVTALLKASRNQDEDTLRYILSSILKKDAPDENVNAVDCSGRTALSYLCSANVTHFLEILLQVPGIDINKPDIELNTPLHYASECGHLGAIRLLLLQNKLEVDAKNVFGFTPLMKAAIQGHTRCAKALLFAGASPYEVDYKRQLQAEQWARFCGRHPCADIIAKCARNRIPEKDNNAKAVANKEQDKPPIKGRARANSAAPSIPKSGLPSSKNSSDGGGIRSKISRVFNFVSRDKSNNNNNSNNGSNNNGNFNQNNMSSTNNKFEFSSTYQKGLAKLSRSDGFLNKCIIRPLEVPKLEVTSPHNEELIRKYEKRYSLGNNEHAKPPALPPRRNSKAIV